MQNGSNGFGIGGGQISGPFITGTLVVTPTPAEKAEAVLAHLLLRLADSTKIIIHESASYDEVSAFRANDSSGVGAFCVDLPLEVPFDDVVDALYTQLCTIRGKTLR